MGIFKNMKNKKIMKKINELNGNKLQIQDHVEGVFRGFIDLNYDKIKLPEGIKSTIHLYSDDGTLQIFFLDENNEKIAVIECLKPEKMIEDQKRKEEEKQKQISEEEKQNEARRIIEEKKIAEFEEVKKRLVKARYESYVNFLINNGAKKELIELKAVKNLILSIIENGDARVIMEGRSPIAYEKPNSDGTFNIAGRLDGPLISTFYQMSYCTDDNLNHFIVLRHQKRENVHYAMDDPIGDDYPIITDEEIYIDTNGNIVDDLKTEKELIKTA